MTTSETPSRETSPFAEPLKTLIRTFKETSEPDFKGKSDSSPSLDEVVNLLGHGRRRAVLEELAETNQRRISVADLAEDIACAEYGCLPSELTSDQRKRVYIALLQSHLPPLDDADIVAYDSDAKVVTQGPQFEYLWHAYTALRDAVRD